MEKCLTLPVVGTSVVGATKGKPISLKKQIFTKVTFNELTANAVFLIVPSLTRDCIIGVDLLKSLRGEIDLGEEILILCKNDRSYIITAKVEAMEKHKEPELRELKLDRRREEELTKEGLKAALNINRQINAARSEGYEALLWKYKEVFNKRPGVIPGYTHQLKLKEGMEPRSNSYPTPLHLETETDKEINKMLDWNVI